MRRAAFLRGAAAFAVAAPAVVRAQGAWPDRQIRMVIPFAAGGTTDLLARALGQHMTQVWGQPVVADNRAGANGVVAGEIVAKSAGDGYTLSMVAMGHAINPLLYKKLPYDGTADFTPLSLVATFPQLVLVHPAVKAGTIAELIALAKTASPPLTYASGGNGSSQHLAGALFEHMAGIKMTHVAYKGGNPAQLDLMAGNVDMMITQPNSRDLITIGQDARACRELGQAQQLLSRAADRRRGGRAGLPVRRLVRPGRAQGHAGRPGEKDRRRSPARRRDRGGQVRRRPAGR